MKNGVYVVITGVEYEHGDHPALSVRVFLDDTSAKECYFATCEAGKVDWVKLVGPLGPGDEVLTNDPERLVSDRFLAAERAREFFERHPTPIIGC